MAMITNAIVKAVLSGDTVIVMGRPQNGPPPEKQLTLALLVAPRLARNAQTGDEPFAWQSREFLRNLIIGKRVDFKVEYKVSAINREFGTIYLNGESVSKAVVRAGWATVRAADEARAEKTDFDELIGLQTQAQDAKAGLWTDNAQLRASAIRDIAWTVAAPNEFFGRYGRVATAAIVEFVRDGSSMRLLLPDSMTYISFMLAGIQCPRLNTPRPAAEGAEVQPDIPPEPYSIQAKFFTEVRILHRQVEVVIDGEKNGSFFGTLVEPNIGNIGLELLRNGFGRVVDWSAAFCTRENRDAMKNAEREAKFARRNVWQNFVAPAVTATNQYEAICVEVLSGDQLVVLVKAPKLEERRVSLASTRAPRVGNARAGQSDEAWASESKEFVRSRLIGKKINVVVDYQREIPRGEGQSGVDRTFVTVTYGKTKQNIAEQLIAEGLATVVFHKQEDDKSSDYAALLAADQASKTAKKNMHSPVSEVPITRITDASTDSRRAKQLIPLLQRQRNLRGMVEYVFTGSRFKILIPSESCAIQLGMSLIRCPNPGKSSDGKTPGRTADPFGEEARLFSREKVMQRFVEIEVDDMDRNGVALGRVYTGTGEQRRSYALELVSQGLAKVDSRAAERRTAEVESLISAQEVAKSQGLGLWSLPQEESETKGEEEEKQDSTVEVMTVRLSEIVDGCTFFVHVVGSNALASIEQRMQAFSRERGPSLPVTLRVGGTCAASFNDGSGPSWFRAKIEEVIQGTPKKARVLYMDYGNRATVPVSSLCPLDATFFQVPPQARECVLAFLRAPKVAQEFGSEAGHALSELAWGKDMIAQVLWRDEENRLAVSLYDGEDPVSVNESMVQQGLARMSRRVMRSGRAARAAQLMQKLVEKEEAAHKAHLNIWHMGDAGDSDDDFGK